MTTRRRGSSGGTGAWPGRTLSDIHWRRRQSRTGTTPTKEDGGINWEVTAHTDAQHGGKEAEDNIVRRGSSGSGGNSSDK